MSFAPTIRRLTVAERLEYLHHLLRLDAKSRRFRFGCAASDAAIQAHCLRHIAADGQILGAFVGDEMRGAVELNPISRPGYGEAELALSVEKEFQRLGLGARLLARALQEMAPARAVLVCWADNTGMVQLARRFAAEIIQQGDCLVFTIKTSAIDCLSSQSRPPVHIDLTSTDIAFAYV